MAAFPENDGFSAAMGPRARLPRAVGEVCLHEIHEIHSRVQPWERGNSWEPMPR